MTPDPRALARARDVELAYERAAPAMAGVGVCNRALSVEVVGLRLHGDAYAGVLVCPWTLSLVVVGGPGGLAPLPAGASEVLRFPGGDLACSGAEAPELGPYRTLSLLSPPAELRSQEEAREAARAALAAVFEPPAPEEAEVPAAARRSRRAFLGGLR